MATLDPKYRELSDLISALQDDAATDEQLERLDALLLADPQARRLYCQYVDMHDSLASLASEPPFPASTLTATTSSGAAAGSWFDRRVSWTLVGALATVVAVLLVALVVQWRVDPGAKLAHTPEEQRTDFSIALLAQLAGVRWSDAATAPRAGAPLPPCTLRLDAGLARIEFYSGATVIVEGPAELELVSAMQARCRQGRLRVEVPPPAAGFVVETPDTQLVDLGTEFGMEVRRDQATDVVVFDGQVELYEPGPTRNMKTRRVLNEGESIRLAKSGESRPMPDDAPFASRSTLDRQLLDQTARQRERWQQGVDRLRDDPDVLVLFAAAESRSEPAAADGAAEEAVAAATAADAPKSRQSATTPAPTALKNQSRVHAGKWDGVIVGSDWVPGRFSWKRALEFNNVSDRVRLSVPGQFSSLSLGVWLRVDALPETYASLLMSDGFEEGDVHWQLTSAGRVALSVQGLKNKNANAYHTPPSISAADFGQWMHLAVTYDRARGVVTHYKNGAPVASEATRADPPLRIGAAELGNWFPADHRTGRPVRNFSGRIDELVIFGRACDAAELSSLHASGEG